MKYEYLLSEGKIGSLTVSNRLVMPAMSETMTDKRGIYTDDEMAYYSERSKGGTGLIITSFGCVDPRGLGAPNQLCAYDREHIVGLKKITEGVHRYGGKIFLQLHHAGRTAESAVTGVQPMGPSAIPTRLDFGGTLEMPREMTKADIKEVIEKFIFSASIAKKSNFDGIEIHCAHSYLLNQFISPMSNKRTDEYGGNTEKRFRIVREIIEGIRAELGRGFPVSVRLESDEGTEDGIKIDESIALAKLIEASGVDLINVSAGGYECTKMCIAPAGYKGEGFLVPNAAAIKKAVAIPVAVVGMIRDFGFANEIVGRGEVDFVVMGRPHIADPYMINKIKSDREDEIRPCITCLHCNDSAETGRMACSVNPTIGYEKDFQHFIKNGGGEKVVVVGGGPSGCEAARVLAIRNFDVTLIEKEANLGGQVSTASVPPHKERMSLLNKYYENILKKLNVNVLCNTEASGQLIESLQPEAVFLATGSTPVKPPVSGIDRENVFTAENLLNEKIVIKNKRVAVVGSGNTGIETAAYLLQMGNDIVLVDMLPQIGMLAGSSGMYVLADLLAAGITTMESQRLKEIQSDKLLLENVVSHDQVEVNADYVVYSLGVRSNRSLGAELKDLRIPTIFIGDAEQTGNIATSVKKGFCAAYFYGATEELI